MKFIVDDSWRCSKDIPTATDEDGTFVNWLEVEASKTEEEAKSAWSMDAEWPDRPLGKSPYALKRAFALNACADNKMTTMLNGQTRFPTQSLCTNT